MISQPVRRLRKTLLLILMIVTAALLVPAHGIRAASLPTSSASSLAKAKKKKLSGIVKVKKTWYYMKKGKPVTSKNGKVVTLGSETGSGGSTASAGSTASEGSTAGTGPTGNTANADDSGNTGSTQGKANSAGTGSAAGVKLFVEKDGTLIKGWHQLGKKLYYTKEKGVIQTSRKVNGITINEKGWAKATAENLKKLPKSELDRYAERIASSVAGRVASKAGKLRAIWNFMSSHNNFRYIRIGDGFSPSTAKSRALSMLRSRGGNCFDFACAFAALAKAIGYDAYMIYGYCPAAAGGMTTHGWVYLSGAGYFDVEGEFAGWGPGVYGYGGNPYSETGRVHF